MNFVKSESSTSSNSKKGMQNIVASVLEDFNHQIETTNQHYAEVIIKVMMTLIENSKESTMQGLTHEIKSAGEYLINNATTGAGRSELVLRSTQTIYLHYISKGLQYSRADNMTELKSSLLKISTELLEIMLTSKDNIKIECFKFFRNRIKVLIFGYSNVIQHVLMEAMKSGIIMQLYIPECRPKCDGLETYNKLTEAGYSCNLIFDTAIGYMMEQIDMVLTGAEAVVENGGIINRIGTYTTAICAKAHKRPFYVLAESFKFARLFPLSQSDLSNTLKQSTEQPKFIDNQTNYESINPLCDYTPPDLITLLFTDLGTFTPSAVSEKLIQIFNK